MRLFFHGLEIVVQHGLQLLRLNAPIHDGAQAVAEKFDPFGIIDEGGILRENAALLRFGEMIFEGDDATPATKREEFEQELHQVQVFRLSGAGPF